MKNLLLLLLSFTLLSCSDMSELNERIFEVQKEHLANSPYKGANEMLVRIKSQKRFRSQELPAVFKELVRQQNQFTDTLIIFEDFDELCVNCPSGRIQLLYQDTLYFMRLKMSGNKANYVGLKVRLDSCFADTDRVHDFYELLEIQSKIQRNENWLLNPLEYGSDHCFDGNHSLVTAVYPGGEIKSMYVRCWIPEWRREIIKE